MLEKASVVGWTLVFTKQARKDSKKLATSGRKSKAQTILQILEKDPFRTPPPFEKLAGDLEGAFSRRIDIQHRIVYEVLHRHQIVKVIRMWTHYE
jgi:Txe/YoeB family toxin of toxin-antitoxin system